MSTGELAKTATQQEEIQRHRLQLDFSPEAYSKLQEIRVKSGAKTNAEVVRNALRLYEWYLEQKANDFKIQLFREGDNVLKEVEILF